MKHMFRLMIPLALFLALISCKREKHFLTDENYRARVEERFLQQKELARGRDAELFGVFEQELSLEEEEALKFLFAYMPLSDLADYDGHFFLNNVRSSFAARDSFAWGREIPEEIFRHFVLPVRVNNENLDTARLVFFSELKDRLKGLSMKDAVLEVNHWCHEKVTYRSTDTRTSSPLMTVKTSFGRCGEESTFTVAALRAVGIPARQCYTPRWAHTDDNHAWVEVWVDGTWHFIGACEPEHDLDLAWFTGPARRAMLVGTNVYGEYKGPEEALFSNEYYTRINLIANYAPVKQVWVDVRDAKGSPLDSAMVEFCLYNYAEFYPVARKFTDEKGLASLTTGLGDLLVWVSKNERYSFAKLTVENTDTMRLTLGEHISHPDIVEIDMVPPVERLPSVKSDTALQKINHLRLKQEDSIRNAYMEGFADSVSVIQLADELKLDRDSLWQIMYASMGNHLEISSFLKGCDSKSRRLAFQLLHVLAEKDLRDTPATVLDDHLLHAAAIYDPSVYPDFGIFCRYVMNPRMGWEKLTPYKSFLKERKAEITGGVAPEKVPAAVKTWINQNVRVHPYANYYGVPASPAGVASLRVADQASCNLLFVACCRSFGIPARIETATGKPQYHDGDWKDILLSAETAKADAQLKKAVLLLQGENQAANLKYAVHYSLAVLGGGRYKTLDYEGDPLLSTLPASLILDAGRYLLLSGNRRADGSVLCRMQFFSLGGEEKKSISILLRAPEAFSKPVAILKDPLMARPFKGKAMQTLTTEGKLPLVLIWIEPGREPTRHVLSEITALKATYESKGVKPVFLLSDKNAPGFDPSRAGDLPQGSSFMVDEGLLSLKKLEALFSENFRERMPVVLIIDDQGGVFYKSSGYSIGRGEQILKIVQQF